MALSNTPRTVLIFASALKSTEASSTILKGQPVKLDTAVDDGCKLCSAATDKAIGVALQDIAPGNWGAVAHFGRVPCLAGGSVSRGDNVGPNGAGKVATTTTNKDRVIGQAARAAATDELFEVLMIGPPTLSA